MTPFSESMRRVLVAVMALDRPTVPAVVEMVGLARRYERREGRFIYPPNRGGDCFDAVRT